MKRTKWVMRIFGLLLAASVGITEGLLLAQGRWREAIPLHLCSVSAAAALLVAGGTTGMTLDFLWYAGMPGALLALIFPAPAVSVHQRLFTGSYVVTHLMIALITLAAFAGGKPPRKRQGARVMLLVQAIALMAFFVNEMLGTNFLFLSLPPAGTPLEAVYALGYPAYILFLEGLMLAVCMAQEWLTLKIFALYK